MSNKELLDNIKKLREMTGVETPVITKVTKVLKKLYKNLYTEYTETGHIKI